MAQRSQEPWQGWFLAPATNATLTQRSHLTESLTRPTQQVGATSQVGKPRSKWLSDLLTVLEPVHGQDSNPDPKGAHVAPGPE